MTKKKLVGFFWGVFYFLLPSSLQRGFYFGETLNENKRNQTSPEPVTDLGEAVAPPRAKLRLCFHDFTDTPDWGERNAQSFCYQSRVAEFFCLEGRLLTGHANWQLNYEAAEGVSTYMVYSWCLMNRLFSIFNAFQIVFSPAKSCLKMSVGY